MPLTQAFSVPQSLPGKTLSDTFMGKVFDTAVTKRDTTLEASTDYVVSSVLENSGSYVLEVPATSTLEVAGYVSSPNLRFDQFYNPYKFGVYRAGAWSTPTNGNTATVFDTKEYDSSSNFSVSTGLFTAPVGGWYRFETSIGCGSTTRVLLDFIKNGTEFKRLVDTGTITATGVNVGGSATLQLAVGDTIGVGLNTPNGSVSGNTGQALVWFMGELISQT